MMMMLLMIAATIGLFKNSSMGHLLLLGAYALHAQILPQQIRVEGMVVGNLLEDVAWAAIVPAQTEGARELHENFPVGPGTGQRSQGTADCLHVMVNVGHAAIFFGERDCGQHHVGLLSRLGQQYILHDDEVQRLW